MRARRNRDVPLFMSCLLGAAMSVTVTAQEKYPPDVAAFPTIALTGGGAPPPAEAPAPGPRDRASAWNMERVGYNDLQGRSAYQPIVINQGGRQIAYVGHHANQKPRLSPISGKVEPNGTSILDVTDTANIRYLAHIATGEERRSSGSQHVRVCSGNTLPKGVKGKWYLLRTLGSRAHEIWDVTDPATPSLLTTIVDNLTGTHKNWWECDTGIAYLVATDSKEGWKSGNHIKIYDLSDPAKPVYIRDFGAVGQQPGATPSKEGGEGLHALTSAGPEKNRLYFSYGAGTHGVITIVDRKKLLTEFKDPLKPTEEELLAPVVGSIRMSPDQGGHNSVPIYGMPMPGFQGHQALRKRDLLIEVSEGARADNCGQNFPSDQLTQGRAAPHFAFLLDITNEATPWPLSTFRVQETQGDYCGRGGRFGAHSVAESFYPPYYGKLAVFAWFNAGVRIWDIRDPLAVHEVAYFVPPANQNTIPTCANAETREGGEFGTDTGPGSCKSAGVINNVEIDDRGLVYAVDRAAGGLHVLKLTGYAAQVVAKPAGSK